MNIKWNRYHIPLLLDYTPHACINQAIPEDKKLPQDNSMWKICFLIPIALSVPQQKNSATAFLRLNAISEFVSELPSNEGSVYI